MTPYFNFSGLEKDYQNIILGTCFSQQRVDYRLDYSTADELTEASSKEDCERHCINAYKFECRGFAYRWV